MLTHNIKRPNFIVSPPSITFSKYQHSLSYCKKITVTNNDVVAHQLLVEIRNRSEEISCQVIGNQKILPGLSISLNVNFLPTLSFEKYKFDRRYEIVLKCKEINYQTVVPVILLSPYPSISFPKCLYMPDTIINAPTYAVMQVINTGKVYQRFTIEHPDVITLIPFKKTYLLKPGTHENVTVTALSKQKDRKAWELKINFDNNRTLIIPVYCNVTCTEVVVTKKVLEFPDTYLGHSAILTTELINYSDSKVTFNISAFKNRTEEEVFKNSIEDSYRGYLSFNYNQVPGDGLIDLETHHVVLDRELQSFQHRLNKKTLVYESNYFTFIPQQGNIAPRSKVLLTVNFQAPDVVPESDASARMQFVSTAFLDYGSPEDRPTVELKATVLGPDIRFETIEHFIGSIFCGQTIGFRLKCHNYGPIPGSVTFKPERDTESLGIKINVEPIEAYLNPFEDLTFKVHFCSTNIGKFLEFLQFRITSGALLKVALKGEILPLTVIISPPTINFNEVTICCPCYKFIKLKNPLPFKINVQINQPSPLNGTCCDQFQELLVFEEFVQPVKDTAWKEPIIPINLKDCASTISLVSEFGACDDLISNIKNYVDGEMFKIVFDYEKIEYNSNVTASQSILSSQMNASNAIETIMNLFNNHIETEELREVIKTEIYQLLESWIEKRKLADSIIDKVLEKILVFSECFSESDCTNDTKSNNFVPFTDKKWLLKENLNEYSVYPKFISLEPGEATHFCINLTSNWPGIFRTSLTVDILWSDTEDQVVKDACKCKNTITVPVKHNCVIPKLIASPERIKLETVMGVECIVVAHLENPHETIDAFVKGLHVDGNNLRVECCPEKMMVPARSCTSVELVVTPLTLGDHCELFTFYTLGNDREIQIELECKAVPATVLIEPRLIIEENVLVNDCHISNFFIKNLSDVEVSYNLYLTSNNPNAYQVEECDGILLANDIIKVRVWKLFKDPGVFDAKLFIVVDQGIKIMSRLISHVSGLPLTVSIPNQIDFGVILFDTQYPTYKFHIENIGSMTYAIWLKHDNANLQLSHSKFYLGVLERECLTLNVSPLKPTRIRDEIIITGSPSGLTKDAVELKRVKVRANIIKCALNWDKDDVIFDIKFGDNYDLTSFDSLKLTNCCPIELNVTCECNGDYELVDFDECENVKRLHFNLPASSTKAIVVHFNTDLIKENNVSGYFSGTLKANVFGKTLATVNLSTALTYPTVEVDRNCFQIYQNFLPCTLQFTIYNSASIPAQYQWEFLEETFIYEPLCPKNLQQCGYNSTVIDDVRQFKDNSLVLNYLKELKQPDPPLVYENEGEIEELIDENEKVEKKVDTKNNGKKKKNRTSFAVDENMTEKSDNTVATRKTKRKSIKNGATKPVKRREGSEKTEIGSKGASEDTTGDWDTGSQISKLSVTKKPNKKGKKSRKSAFEDKPVSIPEETEVIEETIDDIEVTNEDLSEIFTDIGNLFDPQDPRINLEDSGSSYEKVKIKDYLKLNKMEGVLQSNENKVVSLLIETSDIPYYIKVILRLYVKGGISSNVLLKITNDEPKFEINRVNIHLGSHPWFAILQEHLIIKNLSWVPVHIKFLDFPVHNCFVDGHIHLSNRSLTIQNGKQHTIKLFSYMGVRNIFDRKVAVSGNDRAPVIVSICGQAQVPTVTAINCTLLPKLEQENDYSDDYKSLQELHNKINDRKINLSEPVLLVDGENRRKPVVDDKISVLMTPKVSKPSQISLVSVPNPAFQLNSITKTVSGRHLKRSKSLNRQRNLPGSITDTSYSSETSINLFLSENNSIYLVNEEKIDQELTVEELKELDDLDFVFIDTKDLIFPNFLEIKNHLDHSRFLRKLETEPDAYYLLQKFVQKHVFDNMKPTKLAKLNHYTYTGRPRNFVIEPVPEYVTHSYVFDLGEIMLGEKTLCTLPLLFHGLGRFSASCRTETALPGVRIWFQEPKFPHGDSTLLAPFKYTLRSYVPEIAGDGKYKNRHDRINEMKINDNKTVQAQHCHSHDFTKRLIHTRKPRTMDEKKEIEKFYTGISTKFRTQKNPFTYAEIYQETSRDAGQKIFKLNIEWTACSKHFTQGQELNEILYIDIHLGATIPIIVRGKIFKPYRCLCPIFPPPCPPHSSTTSCNFE